MTSALAEPTRVSFDEYLHRWEQLSRSASSAFSSPFVEYVAGTMFEVPEQSANHDGLATCLFNDLWIALGPSFAAQGGVPIRLLSTGGEFGYRPDVWVGTLTDAELHSVDNPIVVLEILSPSTDRIDRGEKRMNYIQIPTLQDYVLVAQDRPTVQHYRRSAGWVPHDLYPGDTLELASVGLNLPLADIFRTINFGPSRETT